MVPLARFVNSPYINAPTSVLWRMAWRKRRRSVSPRRTSSWPKTSSRQEENFPAEFEPENMSCEDMEYFCNKGDEDANRDAGESEMDIQSEKTKHPAVGPEEWDGP
ncbi:hypothetical protein fugu_010418, partial [Takifugu bimaculatus]